jgi:hypothetical protein
LKTGWIETMKTTTFVLLSALATIPLTSSAETVFRCTENGKTAFTANPAGPSCQPLDLKTIEPDPQEAARQRQELEQWKARETSEARRIIERETKAEAQRRKAEPDALGTARTQTGTAYPNQSARGYARRLGRDNRNSKSPEAAEIPATAPDTGTVGVRHK